MHLTPELHLEMNTAERELGLKVTPIVLSVELEWASYLADIQARAESRRAWTGNGGRLQGYDPRRDTDCDMQALVAGYHDYPGASLFDALDERGMA